MSLKNIILKMLWNLPSCFLKNYIVFESVPDFSDNTYPVYEEMLHRNMNRKYKMIWLLDRIPTERDKEKNVKYILRTSKKKFWYLLHAKCMVSCNQCLHNFRKGQYSIYLTHGIPFKRVTAILACPPTVTEMLSPSETVCEVFYEAGNAPLEIIIPLGYPRNDVFARPGKDLHDYFDGDFEKVVVWYPTFRQHRGGVSASDSDDALPILHDEKNARIVSDYAQKHKILIVIKPHFAQDISFFVDVKLPNILFINDDFFVQKKITSYELIASCDGLLTDYSSIFFDYLLADKPVGLTWEDYEQYMSRPGLTQSVLPYTDGGEKIYTTDDLLKFFEHIQTGDDPLREVRREGASKMHIANDGKSASRVVDHLIKRVGL